MALFTCRPEASSDINCIENALLLREDVYTLWDRHKFCIVPKAGRWVVQVIDNATTRELEEIYYNLPLQPLLQVLPIYLLVRFALGIFTVKPAFIKLPVRLRRVVKTDENNQKFVQTLKLLVLPRAEEAESQSQNPSHSPSKSASRSPSKRPRSVEDVEHGRVRGSKRQRDWEAERWGDDLWDQPRYDQDALDDDDENEEDEDDDDCRGRARNVCILS